MAKGSGVTVKIDHQKIPIIAKVLDYAGMGLVPAGAYANRKFTMGDVYISSMVPGNIVDILFDPQTSGGLLISVKESHVEKLLVSLKDTPTEFAIIGHISEQEDKFVTVKKDITTVMWYNKIVISRSKVMKKITNDLIKGVSIKIYECRLFKQILDA